MLEIKTGDLDLFVNGTFIAPALGDTQIKIKSEIEEITFVFELATDRSGEDQIVKITIDDPQTARFKLTNWNNPLGGGLLEPLNIGTFDNRQLFVFFVIQKLGLESEARLIIFNAYLGAEVRDGQD